MIAFQMLCTCVRVSECVGDGASECVSGGITELVSE